MVTQYNSLEELRAQKALVSRRIGRGIESLRGEVHTNFVPSNPLFRHSPSRLFKIVGYGITIYKTVMSVRGVVKFFTKRFR